MVRVLVGPIYPGQSARGTSPVPPPGVTQQGTTYYVGGVVVLINRGEHRAIATAEAITCIWSNNSS